MNWFCQFDPDTTFLQKFEHGLLVGPFRMSKNAKLGHVVVILDDHTWHLSDFKGPISECRAGLSEIE